MCKVGKYIVDIQIPKLFDAEKDVQLMLEGPLTPHTSYVGNLCKPCPLPGLTSLPNSGWLVCTAIIGYSSKGWMSGVVCTFHVTRPTCLPGLDTCMEGRPLPELSGGSAAIAKRRVAGITIVPLFLYTLTSPTYPDPYMDKGNAAHTLVEQHRPEA